MIPMTYIDPMLPGIKEDAGWALPQPRLKSETAVSSASSEREGRDLVLTTIDAWGLD